MLHILQLIRTLVSPSNPTQITNSCQQATSNSGVMEQLTAILLGQFICTLVFQTKQYHILQQVVYQQMCWQKLSTHLQRWSGGITTTRRSLWVSRLLLNLQGLLLFSFSCPWLMTNNPSAWDVLCCTVSRGESYVEHSYSKRYLLNSILAKFIFWSLKILEFNNNLS